MIAGVGCLLAPIPFLFYRYGAAIRRRSRFSPTEPSKDEENTDHQSARESSTRRHSSSESEELALDEQAGVLERVAEPEVSKESAYQDAHGLEKAE